ncbi:MAG: ABC transporter permease [Defluviitaleaceae bacterium]|nr:ABC transporter permease [Defluviitaleaceae bacterium]
MLKRNILLFFRDKANVFFSLLAVLIIIALYVLFLGGIMEDGLRQQLGFDAPQAGVVIASITLGGMVAVSSVTSCLGAMGISIADKQAAAKDFFTSPVSRGKIALSYMLGSAVAGLIMSLAALALVLLYLAVKGAGVPSSADLARLVFTVILSVLCGNSIGTFFCSFIKSQGAFTALSTVIGTLIGFLMGIYIPIGSFPNAVQWVIRCFPMTHAASMFRQVLADKQLAELFANAPSHALDDFREMYGVVLTYGGFTSGFWFSAGVLVVSTVVFCLGGVWRLQK